jgi:hypothetical protein
VRTWAAEADSLAWIAEKLKEFGLAQILGFRIDQLQEVRSTGHPKDPCVLIVLYGAGQRVGWLAYLASLWRSERTFEFFLEGNCYPLGLLLAQGSGLI